jgi:hypothetical protein
MQIPPHQHPQHMGMPRGSSQGGGGGSGGMQPPPSENRQQQYIPTVLNGNWQSDKDMPHRREMIQHM